MNFIEKIMSQGLQLLLNIKQNIEINSTLTVDALDANDEYCIYINSKQKKLYAVELSGTGNVQKTLEDKDIEIIYDTFSYDDNSIITQVFYKQNMEQKNIIFTPNKDISEIFAKRLDAKRLNYNDMIDLLYKLFLNNSYYIKDKELHSNIDIANNLKYEVLSRSVNIAITDAVYNNFNKLELYQGFRVKKRLSSIETSKLFQLNWNGVIFNTYDLSRTSTELLISTRKNQAFVDGKQKPLSELLDKYRAGEVKLATFNSSILLENGGLNSAIDIGNVLNIDYQVKLLNKEKYIKYTPLCQIDHYFDCIIDIDFIYGAFSNIHKQHVSSPDFYGYDTNGAFFTGRLDKPTNNHSNKSMDSLILGVKGSGKTTATNILFSQILGISLSEDIAYKNGDFDTLYNRNKIRYFDIKKSGLKIAHLLHDKKPESVKFITTNLADFSFNPLNIKRETSSSGKTTIDENELTMNILLLSIILESKNRDGQSGLTGAEQATLKKIIMEIYENNLYDLDYVEKFKTENPRIYNEFIQLGYKDTDSLNVIKEKEYDFLKSPTLDTALKRCFGLSKDTSNANQASIASGLYAKLELIKTINIFNGHDKFNFEDGNFIHIDFDPVKDLDEYIPVFLSLFIKIYRNDKFMQENDTSGNRPYIRYVMEEANNVTSQSSFSDLLAKFINEARSYRISITFITQLPEHIPAHMFKQVANKFILLPSANQRNILINDIKEKLELSDADVKLANETKEFFMLWFNEHGTSSFQLGATKEEIDFYGQSI